MTDLVYGLVFAALMNAGDDAAAYKLQPCSSNSCIMLARWECFWPGQPGVKCSHCKNRSETIARALGFELQSKALDVAIGLDDTSKRYSLLELK